MDTMKRSVLLALFLLSAMTSVIAQTQKIAVLEPAVEKYSKVLPAHSSILRSLLLSLFTQTNGYELYTRSDMGNIAEELNFQQSGMVNDSTIKKLGEIEGVDLLCVSKLSAADKYVAVELSMINVQTGKLEKVGGGLLPADIEEYTTEAANTCVKFLGLEVKKPAVYYLVFKNRHSSPRRITIDGEYIGTVGGYATKKFTVPLRLIGECKSVQTEDYLFSPNVETTTIHSVKENATITIDN